MCKSADDTNCPCVCKNGTHGYGCTEQCIKDWMAFLAEEIKKEKEEAAKSDWWKKNPQSDPNDVEPTGTIPTVDCLDAANNLITDLRKENRGLQEKFEAQKRKADSFENTLAETEEKLEKTNLLLRSAEKEVDMLKKQEGQNEPKRKTWAVPFLLSIIFGILFASAAFFERARAERWQDEFVKLDKANVETLIAELEKSQSNAKKLAGEIDELKKQITPPEPVEEKKEVKVDDKKRQRDDWALGCFFLISCFSLLGLGIVSCEELRRFFGGYIPGVVSFVIAICLFFGLCYLYLSKPAPQDEAVQVEQLQEKPENKSVPVSQVSTPVKKQPAFVGNAKILYKANNRKIPYKALILSEPLDPYFAIELSDGRKAKVFVDSKFFNLAQIGEVIAVYGNDKIEFENPTPPPKEKKRVEY